MCHPARCRKCSKTTWSGCGSHVDQVMRHVPKDQRCQCSSKTTAAPAEPGRSLTSRLFGRSKA